MDVGVYAFTLAVTLARGVLFGLAPGLESFKLKLTNSLREGGRTGTGGLASRRFTDALLVIEVGCRGGPHAPQFVEPHRHGPRAQSAWRADHAGMAA